MNLKKQLLGILKITFCMTMAVSGIGCAKNGQSEMNTISQNVLSGSDEAITDEVISEEALDPTDELLPLEIHYMDVGQGDATLITCNGEAMLIDAGDNSCGTKLQNYIRKQGVKSLKYMIGTHPDADHVGGMDVIITKFDCDMILLPDYQSDTQTYRDVLDAVIYRNEYVTVPKVGECYTLGDAEFTVLSPSRIYEDSNNNSIALRLTYGERSFLFTGDAEYEAESDMLQGNQSLQSDVYKVGHHGSKTATSEQFLRTVSPKYAVISCGSDNDYGHPHAEVLNRLREYGVQVFRTDEQGSIIATCDGSNILWSCSPTDTWQAGEGGMEQPRQQDASQEAAGGDPAADGKISYVCNTNTKKFHLTECTAVSRIHEKNKLYATSTRSELIAEGYEPCGICKP